MFIDPVALARRLGGDLVQAGWDRLARLAAIGPEHRRGRAFGHLGEGATICFPVAALFGERWMHLGEGTLIGPYASLAAGVAPGHVPDHDPALRVGARCVIGKGTGIVAHSSVEIGDDVWTGHQVYITDANHGYEDVTTVPGAQFAPSRPVRIADGAWLGHGTIVLPGSTVGEHAVVGAGSIVAGEIPPFCVAVGNPARVVRRHVPGVGWTRAHEHDGSLVVVDGGVGTGDDDANDNANDIGKANGTSRTVPATAPYPTRSPEVPAAEGHSSPSRPEGALSAGPPHGES